MDLEGGLPRRRRGASRPKELAPQAEAEVPPPQPSELFRLSQGSHLPSTDVRQSTLGRSTPRDSQTTLRVVTDPERKAFGRSFRRDWWRRAWKRTVEIEMRSGIVVSLILTVVVGVVTSIAGDQLLNVPDVAFGTVASFVVVGVIILGWAWLTTPTQLVYERTYAGEMDNDPHDRHNLTPIGTRLAGTNRGISMTTTTSRQRDRLIKGGFRPTALRFVEPREVSVRPSDVPKRVRLGLSFFITVKDFYATGFWIDEHRSSGRSFTVEVYGPSEGEG